MTKAPVNILGICGSLRVASTNAALLRAAAAAAAPDGVCLALYAGLATLPIFNPDVEAMRLPDPARDLRERVGAAHGIVIASPEYARGVPGGLKNALDWLVGGSEMVGKPVALFHATARGTTARAALVEILGTMSAAVLDEASVTVPLMGHDPEAAARALASVETVEALRLALRRFARGIEALGTQDVRTGVDWPKEGQ